MKAKSKKKLKKTTPTVQPTPPPAAKVPPPPPPKKAPPPPPPRNPQAVIDVTTKAFAEIDKVTGLRPETRPLCEFREGQQVDIPGCYKNLTIDRISDGGVTVSGGGLTPGTVLSRQSPAMLVWTRPATDKEPGVQVIVPAEGHGDFSSARGGTVQRVGGKPLPPGAPPPPPKPVAPRAPGAGKREGVCAFIDALIMEGGRTAEEVLALVMAKFPGRDPKSTLATVKTRPSHIKAKGTTPPPFKAAK